MVFPGGKLEPQDADGAWAPSAQGWQALDAQDRSLRICAIRETYEETAVLLAKPQAGEAVPGRRSEPRQPRPFLDLLSQRDLVLELDSVTPFARWITPDGVAVRFDATFFIAAAPDGQLATSDGFETVSAEWIEPLHALDLAERGERTLMFPTRVNLKQLGESRCAAEAIAAPVLVNCHYGPSYLGPTDNSASAAQYVRDVAYIAGDGYQPVTAVQPRLGSVPTVLNEAP